MSEENKNNKYFSFEHLQLLNALEGKILSDVIYFVWINRIQQQSPLIFIDKLQLKFEDKSFITLSAGEESDGLRIIENFDPAQEALRLDEQFSGKILLKPHNAKKDRFWEEVTGRPIWYVQLSKENDQYLSDAIVLDFGKEKRLIAVSPEEGIIIDFYEED